jgi:fucose 4-O-acetylase-like acetyltransferase
MRIKWIDVGKGIGLLLVILGHLVIYGQSVFNWIFSFHMPLFFFLSGYIFKSEVKNLKPFLKKIGINLIVPYFVFVIIGLVVSLIVPGWQPTSYKVVFLDVFYAVTPESLHVGQIWFLFCLAVVQILFWLYLKLNLKNKYSITGSVFLFAIIAFLIHKFNIYFIIDKMYYRFLPFKLDTAFMGLFFFSAGYYAKLVDIFSELPAKKVNLNILFMLIALGINIFFGAHLNGMVNIADNNYNNLIYYVIAAFAGILVVIYLSKLLENDILLSYMGKNSLSIFSSHSFFLFLYTSIISIIFGTTYIFMLNMPLVLCLAGVIFIGAISLIVPIIYNNTVQKLLLRMKYSSVLNFIFNII